MDLKVVVVVALALGMGFVASESDFANISEIENVVGSSNKQNVCPQNLSTYLDKNIKSMKISSDIKTSDYSIDVSGLNNWEASEDYEFSCRDGYEKGENVNYVYCTPKIVGSLEYEKIDSSGNIVEQRTINLDKFILDGNEKLVSVECSKNEFSN